MNIWNLIMPALGSVMTILGTISTIAGHRASKSANDIQRDSVSTQRFEAINKAQDQRIDDLESDVGQLKADLKAERDDHSLTRKLFGVAVRHIRSMYVWAATDHTTPVPPPPAELLDQL